MFRTGSPYSPFFNSGFLSESIPCSSRSASPEPPLGPRRGSLPTDTPPTLSPDESSAFYFTLQPQRDEHEFRSFLSLDLAESQSLRSASLKRKASSAPSTSSRVGKTSFSLFALIPEAPRRLGPPPIPLRVRMSRDSLRTIPSPKPAPSITLPDLPKYSTPSSSSSSPVTVTPPRLPSFTFSTSLGLSLERASHSAPALVVSRTSTPAVVHELPKRFSTITNSSVSTRARRVNRSDALARLEGRSKPSNLPSPPRLHAEQNQNFMSMSDDEDDADTESFDLQVDEPEDIVFPAPVRTPSLIKSVPIDGRFPSLTSFRSSSSRGFKHQQDWFPLKSFIDLRNDEDASAWSWRSWIEVANVS